MKSFIVKEELLIKIIKLLGNLNLEKVSYFELNSLIKEVELSNEYIEETKKDEKPEHEEIVSESKV